MRIETAGLNLMYRLSPDDKCYPISEISFFPALEKNCPTLQRSTLGHQMSTNGVHVIILFTLMATCAATPIFVAHPGTVLAHPAVLINSAMEDSLPNELRNDFYKDPNIAAGLAKESWFIDKETQVQPYLVNKLSIENSRSCH